MLRDVGRVLAQAGDRRLWGIVVRAVAATAALLAAAVAALSVGLAALPTTGWAALDAAVPWLGGAGGAVVAIVIAPLVTLSVLGLFVDDVAAAVEARWYPDLPTPPTTSVLVGLGHALRLLGLATVLNVLALPAYLVFPAANVVLFVALNGYLFGREYFDAVAARRAPVDVVRLRRAYRGQVFAVGVAIAIFALVPIVNFLVPVVGTALMVHALESARRADGGLSEGRKA